MTSIVDVPRAAPGGRPGQRPSRRQASSASRRLRSKRRSELTRTVVTYVLLAAGGVILLIPFAWLISTSLKPPT